MKKKIIIYLVGLIICGILAFFIYEMIESGEKKDKSNMKNKNEEDNLIIENNPLETKSIGVKINGNLFVADLEDNRTVNDFLNLMPFEVEMNDLNNNEKYVYINETLYSDNSYTGHISKGDIMLYSNNCIVVFYKDFDTTYRYTKIGHINDLPELGNSSLTISFQRQ